MRKIICGLLALVLLSSVQLGAEEKELKGTITISGAWALYPMVVRWAEEFQKIHPRVRMDVAAGGAGKGIADCLAGIADLGMVSREIHPAEVEKGAWWVSVTKDAVVATVNENNPVAKDLFSRGVERKTLIGIWVQGAVRNWGEVVGSQLPQSIHVYTRSDACGAAETWAKYLEKNQEDLQGVGVYGDPGLAEAVKNDILGIGYNNINYVYDAGTKNQIKGIRVLPIDLNGNGRLDEDENFYRSRDEIVGAIASGKYPSPPARELNLVSRGVPRNELAREFIKWILTDGQKYVPEAGYIELSPGQLKKELEKLQAQSR